MAVEKPNSASERFIRVKAAVLGVANSLPLLGHRCLKGPLRNDLDTTLHVDIPQPMKNGSTSTSQLEYDRYYSELQRLHIESIPKKK